ncbi:MAG: hypothetical protein ABFS56_13870 [Pseudomonadota bacterium]
MIDGLSSQGAYSLDIDHATPVLWFWRFKVRELATLALVSTLSLVHAPRLAADEAVGSADCLYVDCC